MTSQGSVLDNLLEKYDVEHVKNIMLSVSSRSGLETMLNKVLSDFLPKQSDYDHRRALINTIGGLVENNLCSGVDKPVVEAFGSFIMDMFTADSDLDLSVKLSGDSDRIFSRNEQITFLRKFAKVLYLLQDKGGVKHVQPILSARVPIIKFIDNATGIECDISVENNDGVLKSLILFLISSIDDRFRILSFLLKLWAKAHDINSSKDHTLNSISVTLLVIIHLQTREPPILPPLSAILKGGNYPSNLKESIKEFKGFGQANKETVAELFVSLFSELLSVKTLWKHGLCASTFDGSWICGKPSHLIDMINLEDFIKRSENCARAVTKKKFNLIYHHIRNTHKNLLLFNKGKIDMSELKSMLFKPFDVLEPKKNPKKIKLSKRKKLHLPGSATAGRTTAIPKPDPANWDALVVQQNGQMETTDNWKRHSGGAAVLKRRRLPGDVENVASTSADNAGFHFAIPPRSAGLDTLREDPQKNHIQPGIHAARKPVPSISLGSVSHTPDLRKKGQWSSGHIEATWHQQKHPDLNSHRPPVLPHQQHQGFGWQQPRPPCLPHQIYNGLQLPHGLHPHRQSYPQQYAGIGMQQPNMHPYVASEPRWTQDIHMPRHAPTHFGNPGYGLSQHNWHLANSLVYPPNQASRDPNNQVRQPNVVDQLYRPPNRPFHWP